MLLNLLAAAGITFAIQHKMPFLHKKHPLLDRMLKCTFCTGFHGGWIAALIASGTAVQIQQVLLYAFAGAIFSYALDEIVKYFEEAGYGDDKE